MGWFGKQQDVMHMVIPDDVEKITRVFRASPHEPSKKGWEFAARTQSGASGYLKKEPGARMWRGTVKPNSAIGEVQRGIGRNKPLLVSDVEWTPIM